MKFVWILGLGFGSIHLVRSANPWINSFSTQNFDSSKISLVKTGGAWTWRAPNYSLSKPNFFNYFDQNFCLCHVSSAPFGAVRGPKTDSPFKSIFLSVCGSVGEGSPFIWWYKNLFLRLQFDSEMESFSVSVSLATTPALRCFSPPVKLSPLPTSRSPLRSGIQNVASCHLDPK